MDGETGDGGRYPPDLVPRPDPTKLTTEAVERATALFRRELDSLRELLSERIDTAVSERVRALGALQALIEQRLDGMDRATALLASDLRHVPTAVDERITALRELLESRLDGIAEATRLHNDQAARLVAVASSEVDHLKTLHGERFDSIALQFAERDIRVGQASTASAAALAAALQAAKEAVFENSQAAAKAAEKTELSFTKQIDQIGLRIDTVAKNYDDRLTELKERIDRGEGSTSGAAGTRSDQRLNMGTVIAAAAVLIALVSLVLYVTKK